LSASFIDIKNPEDVAAPLPDVLKYIWREGEFPNGPFKTGEKILMLPANPKSTLLTRTKQIAKKSK
jgi:hypothetical protein